MVDEIMEGRVTFRGMGKSRILYSITLAYKNQANSFAVQEVS